MRRCRRHCNGRVGWPMVKTCLRFYYVKEVQDQEATIKAPDILTPAPTPSANSLCPFKPTPFPFSGQQLLTTQICAGHSHAP